jgi:hypothetical protein
MDQSNIQGVDTALFKKAVVICQHLVGFPCEVVMFHHECGRLAGYRMQPDLKIMENNLTCYTYLKGFAEWYMKAHQQFTGIEKMKVFKDLISAIFDFGGYWRQYAAFDPGMSSAVVQLCSKAMTAAAMEMAAEYENKKAGN